MGDVPPLASLEGLPSDVLAHVFELLDAGDLARLGRVSRWMYRRVSQQGIPLYLSQHRVAYLSLFPPSSQWPPSRLFTYQSQIEARIGNHELYAVQIGDAFRKCLPVLSMDSDSLVVGAGGEILVHSLIQPRSFGQNGRRGGEKKYGAKVPSPARSIRLSDRSDADIVGVHLLPPRAAGGVGGEAIVAQWDGTLQRLSLRDGRSTAHYAHPREHIYSLSGSGDRFMALSVGEGRIYSSRSPWISPTEFRFSGRPWSGLLTPTSAYVGLKGAIDTYTLTPTGPRPQLSLRSSNSAPSSPNGFVIDSLDALDSALDRHARLSTPYSISVRGTQVLSAWHDGAARLHDLRSGRMEAEYRDPWQDAPLYCAEYLGEHSLAAGGSQHGVVAVFDIRTRGGWSVFTPHGRGSPVYALKSDGGRVWGVSERRAFVLAFDGSGGLEGGLREGEIGWGMEGRGGGEGRGRGWGRGGRGMRARDIPTGYRRRGGKWAWTVGFGEHAKEACMGYRHEENGTNLFETLVPA